jgi:transposase
MYLDYDTLITEAPADLAAIERRHRHSPLADRLKMLRLLKSGAARSRRALADTLGYSERQLHRWFDAYRDGGLDALLRYEATGGSAERITPEALAALETEMKAGRVAGLKDAQALLAEHFEIAYSIGGLSDLFQRKRIKLKTGRRRHVKASAAEQEAWKKTVPR